MPAQVRGGARWARPLSRSQFTSCFCGGVCFFGGASGSRGHCPHLRSPRRVSSFLLTDHAVEQRGTARASTGSGWAHVTGVGPRTTPGGPSQETKSPWELWPRASPWHRMPDSAEGHVQCQLRGGGQASAGLSREARRTQPGQAVPTDQRRAGRAQDQFRLKPLDSIAASRSLSSSFSRSRCSSSRATRESLCSTTSSISFRIFFSSASSSSVFR